MEDRRDGIDNPDMPENTQTDQPVEGPESGAAAGVPEDGAPGGGEASPHRREAADPGDEDETAAPDCAGKGTVQEGGADPPQQTDGADQPEPDQNPEEAAAPPAPGASPCLPGGIGATPAAPVRGPLALLYVNGKRSNRRIAAAAAVALVVIVCIIAFISWETVDSPWFDDSEYTASGIVYLENPGDLTLDYIEENLWVSHRAAYSVREDADRGRFAIQLPYPNATPYTLTLPLPRGEDVTITVGMDILSVRATNRNLHDHPVDEGIILQFSEDVHRDELRAAMTIEPAIGYNIDYIQENILLITPEEELQHNRDYVLTIDSSLRSYDESVALAEDFVLLIHTQRLEFQVKLTNPDAGLLTLADDIVVEFQTLADHTLEESLARQPVTVNLYRFADMEAYLALSRGLMASGGEADPEEEIPGELAGLNLPELELLGTDVHTLAKGLTAWERENPGLGGYLLQMTSVNPESGEEYELRKAFAVTDLSLYAQTSGTQTLVWLNSSVTGLPLGGYEVAFRKDGGEDPVVAAVTDADGIAILEFAEKDPADQYILQNPADILTLRDTDGALVYVDNTRVLNYYSAYTIESSQRYYAFFHTDRPLYKPTDEIQFWGYIQPYRGNTDPMPATATIILGEGTLDQQVEVAIGADGTFQGAMDVESVKSGQYGLVVKIPAVRLAEGLGGEEPGSAYLAPLRSRYLQIKEYEKPTYLIQSEVDKACYLPGEDVTVTVTPTFYDGTPMPHYDLIFTAYQYYYGDESFERTITTDENGVATITFPAQQLQLQHNQGWTPVRNRYMVRIVDDGENIVLTGSYTYLPTDIYYSGAINREESGAFSLDLGAYTIDLSGITADDPLLEQSFSASGRTWSTTLDEEYDAWRGEPLDMELTITTDYTYYTKNGSRVSRKGTYYSEHALLERGYSASAENRSDTKRETETAVEAYTTRDGRLRIDSLIPGDYDPEKYIGLSVTVEGEDSTGRTITGRAYYYRGNEYEYNTDESGPRAYNWRVTNNRGESVLGPYYEWITYSSAAFEPGEQMNFELYYRDEAAPNEGRLLYTVLQDKVIDRGFTTGNTLHFTQTVANANSIGVVAAYFDGEVVHPIRDVVITLDKENMELDVEITPAQEGYHPGDTVRVDIRVTDAQGNGVAGNTIVSVVDEAVFALQEQSIDALYDLYRDMYFSHYGVRKYTTTTGDCREEEDGRGDGGKGGDGALSFLQNLRRNFRDTAFFQPVRTDAQGRASVSFALPDNVTSWRVTGAAIGDNLYAGQSKANFVSTMPFFIKPVVSTKYIAGDEVAILVQGHGVALDESSVIDYQVRVTGDGVDQTKAATAAAYESVELSFGKLDEGEYTLLVAAGSGDYTDAIEMKFAVIHSNLELVVNRPLDLSQPLDIAAMRYPVTISFYDHAHRSYFDTLSSLLTHYCMQASQQLSRYVAKVRLTQSMDWSDIPQHIRGNTLDLAILQNSDGGITWAQGNPSEVLLSAKATLVAKDGFNEAALANYFHKVIAERSSPVRNMSARLVEIDDPDWEMIAASYLALAHLGEDVEEEILERLEQPGASLHEKAYLIAALACAGDETRARREYDAAFSALKKQGAHGWYIEADKNDMERNNAVTATAWIAASLLHPEDADLFSAYFAARPWRFSTLFEGMIYVLNYDREVSESAFAYTLKGREQTLSLGVRGQATLVLNKSDLESFALLDTPSTLSATAYYIGEPDEADFTQSELYTVEKTITQGENGRSTVTLTLQFDSEAPLGQYDISEWIPSNARLYKHNKATANGREKYCSTTTEGQKIYYRVYRARGESHIQLSYEIQQTFTTEAVLDSTYVIHGDSGESFMTERAMFSPE